MIQFYLPYIIPTLVFAFWSVTFIESAGSKIFDIQGNLDYFRGQFKNSVLAPIIDPCFYFILLLEITSGVLSLVSLVLLYFFLDHFFKFSVINMGVICFTILSLFSGQRIAKDYAGASGIVGYLIVCLISLMALYGK